MATCKECLHYCVCKAVADTGKFALDTERTDQSERCPNFADKSRFIELPCKYGDIVWCVSETKIVGATAFSTMVYKDGAEVNLEFQCDTDCDNCPFSDWSQSYCGEWRCSGEYGETMVKASDFRKWIFLTREEAEAALARKREEKV